MDRAREDSQVSQSEVVGSEPLGNLPRYAIFRGKRVKILGYDKDARRPFDILLPNDDRYQASREQLTFIKQPKVKPRAKVREISNLVPRQMDPVDAGVQDTSLTLW